MSVRMEYEIYYPELIEEECSAASLSDRFQIKEGYLQVKPLNANIQTPGKNNKAVGRKERSV